MEAHERLKAWLAEQDVSQAEMARRCEYDRSNFNRIVTGEAVPTLRLAVAIERETAGAIAASGWIAEAA